MAEEKEVKKFDSKDVENAVAKLMKGSITTLLDRDKIDLDTILPMIYKNSPALDGETVEQYAARCIETAYTFKIQERYVNSVEKNEEPLERNVIYREENGETQVEPEGETHAEGEAVYIKAKDAQMKFLKMVFGMSMGALSGFIKENSKTMIIKPEEISMVELSEEQKQKLLSLIDQRRKKLREAFEEKKVTVLENADSELEELLALGERDAITAQVTPTNENVVERPGVDNPAPEGITDTSAAPVTDEETIEGETAQEAIVEPTQFKNEILNILDNNPEIRKSFEEAGLKVDDVLEKALVICPKEENETVQAYAQRALKAVMQASKIVEVEARDAKKLVDQVPPPEGPAEEDKDGLTTRRLNFDEEEGIIKKDKLESVGQQEAGSNLLFDSLGKLAKAPFVILKTLITGKSEEELKMMQQQINTREVILNMSPASRDELTNYFAKLDKQFENIIYSREDRKSGSKVDKTTIPFKKEAATSDKSIPVDTAQDAPGANTAGAPVQEENAEPNVQTEKDGIQADMTVLAESFEKINFDDPEEILGWIAKYAALSARGGKIPDEYKGKIVEEFEKHKYPSDKTFQLPTYEGLSDKAKQAYVLTCASRSIANPGDDLGVTDAQLSDMAGETMKKIKNIDNPIVEDGAEVSEDPATSNAVPETVQEGPGVSENSGAEKLDPNKVTAVQGVTEETIKSGRGNQEGIKITETMRRDMHPELVAALEAEKKEMEGSEEFDEHDPMSKYANGR